MTRLLSLPGTRPKRMPTLEDRSTRTISAICVAVAALLSIMGSAYAGAQRPRTTAVNPSAALPSPTTTPAATVAVAQALSLTPAQRPAHRAEISFSQGMLSVLADNASLNQILREIGRQTGISITGGVAEERVFGKYGPSPAPEVLATLLDGTGSNMLMIPADRGSRGQLILTPRHGGPTPPNPNAPGFDDETANDTEGIQRFRPPNPGVSIFGEAPGVQGVPPTGLPATGNDPANPANAVNPQSPNGIKTPQEIMQQLQLLRQQQQQTPPQP